MTEVLVFPSKEVREALKTLTSHHVDPDEEVEAALVVVGELQGGTWTTPRMATLALSALFRNRTHYKALVLAEGLAKLDHPEVRLLGLGLVRERGSLEDLEVGRLLLDG